MRVPPSMARINHPRQGAVRVMPPMRGSGSQVSRGQTRSARAGCAGEGTIRMCTGPPRARSRPGSGWYSRDPDLDCGSLRPGTRVPGPKLVTSGTGRGLWAEGPGGNRSGAVEVPRRSPGPTARERPHTIPRPPRPGWWGESRARRSRPLGISRPVSLTGKPGRKGDLSLQPRAAAHQCLTCLRGESGPATGTAASYLLESNPKEGSLRPRPPQWEVGTAGSSSRGRQSRLRWGTPGRA